jgi:anti-sigma-K factor RskA
MIDDRQEELASLHAFGLLESPEKEAFVAEMAKNPELAKLVADLRFASTALAHTAPEATPPEALRARVLASAKLVELGAAPKAPDNVALFPTWVPWLAAACLSVATIWAGRKYSMTRQEFASMSEQQQVALQELDQARAQLALTKQQLADATVTLGKLSEKLKDEGDLAKYKIATLASMLGNTPAAVAVAVWDPTRERGVLSVSKLPALASEKDYQLWVIDAKYPAPVSAGTFVVDPVTGEAHIVFKADKPVDSIAKFAVSLERKGGSVSPQGPIVLISQ